MTYQDIVIQKEISRLCHFTHISNLESILTNGILSYYSGINRNDPDRWDNHLDYVCTSVEYPNTFYLSDLVKRTETHIEDWVILEINTSVLNDTSLFSPVNAASKKGAYLSSGVEAFEKLFAKKLEVNQRDRNDNWADCAPTDLQAEVLIFGKIEISDIKGIIFHTNFDRNVLPKNIPEWIRLRYSTYLFEKYGVVNWLNIGKVPFDFELR